MRKAVPVVTDQGNLVMDLATAGCIGDPQALKKESNNLPDVLGNGLFVNLTTQGLVEEIVDKLPGVRELTKR